ncbi:hypothetical protein HMPREF3226_01757 [Prevotella corporis]|uniref:Uncharacterized protein n=1 Tax=Prevotella corporis TaxID=28128 RepID=A0A133Q2R3_9BACT|nr:hypothetical protein HMPREF3226_01757 [Prevotella corporis]
MNKKSLIGWFVQVNFALETFCKPIAQNRQGTPDGSSCPH